MDDEPITSDFDIYVRVECLKAIDNMAERASAVGVFLYTTEEDLINGVETLAHAMTNGNINQFECEPESRRFVRGR